LAIVLSSCALALSLYVFFHSRRKDKRDLFLRMHEQLVSPDRQRGRRLLYEMASTGRSVEDLEADEYESINNALAYLDVLGIYYKNRYVRRQDVMEIWALPLVRLMQAAQPFLEHRDTDQGSPIWPRLRTLTTEAQLYLDRHHLTVRPVTLTSSSQEPADP
jgi:hypothetical protein